MAILRLIYVLMFWAVTAMAAAAIALLIVRAIFNYTDVNPFTWSAINVKRATDPIVLPIRRLLVAMRLDPIVASIIAAVVVLLIAVFVVQVIGGTLNTIAGIIFALTSGIANVPMAILGYLIYALIGLYELVIFARIIGGWFVTGYGNRWMRFLIQLTEPLLAPLRRMVPLVGMFDISPIIAFVILWVLQAVVASTILRGLPVQFL